MFNAKSQRRKESINWKWVISYFAPSRLCVKRPEYLRNGYNVKSANGSLALSMAEAFGVMRQHGAGRRLHGCGKLRQRKRQTGAE